MNNTLKRAIRTFFQAALGYLVAALGGGIAGLYDAEGRISKVALGGLVVSAVAAGLAALMNLPKAETAPDIEVVYDLKEAEKYDNLEADPEAGREYEESVNMFDGDKIAEDADNE